MHLPVQTHVSKQQQQIQDTLKVQVHIMPGLNKQQQHSYSLLNPAALQFNFIHVG